MTIEIDEAPLASGARLGLLREGPVDGTPMILLHGIPSGAELWRVIISKLAQKGFRCAAPDLPGYGRTRLVEGKDYSIFATARLLAEWLDDEGLEGVWLVAHDWGGAVAQVMAARHSDRLARLTLSNSPVEDSWPVTSVRLFRLIAKLGLYAPSAALNLVPNPYATGQLNRGFHDRSRLPRETWKRVFWDSKVSTPDGRNEFQRHLASLDNSQTVEIAPELASVSMPIRLIWGSQDRFQPWERVGVRLQALLPDPEVRLIDDAGHFHPLERPNAFVEALIN